ncbi:multicopper oxidase family protein [Microtetraspora malaysiensis]|uniref:multicopper oxidase family protein n=1 Tax=Microtetraspora malaysiensis TaxID=161358 RepID=UPI003D8DC9BE
MLTRREFVCLAAVAAGAVATGAGVRGATATARGLRKYVDRLPRLPVAVPDRTVYPDADYYELTMRQRPWRFHTDLGATVAWGYWASAPSGGGGPAGLGCLGPILVARRYRPSVVRYRNDLPTTHLLHRSIDPTLWRQVPGSPPDPSGGRHMDDLPRGLTVWNVVHLHGGWNPPQSDGNPGAWFSPQGQHGPLYGSLPGAASNEAIYAYGNQQLGTMLWYHDHAMEITRLNNYAGLSGVYLIRDQDEEALGLPRGRFEIPLVLQDRTFNRDGSLFYPSKGVTPYHPVWSPEFFGDTPIVNGKAYPFLEVQPRRYRLRVLNGSNSRFYHLWFGDGRTRLPFWLIGLGGGLRGSALRLTELLMAPADRMDLVVDFASVPAGGGVTLMNDAPAPYPSGGGGPAIPEIMRFQVTEPLSGRDPTMPPEKLALPPFEPLRAGEGTRWRERVLTETTDRRDNPIHMQINGRFFYEPVDDFVRAGATEVWEYVNTTPDAHPMHVHLVQFHVYNRQRFRADAYKKDYARWLSAGRPADGKPVLAGYLVGGPLPPAPEEQGWRDSFVALPQMVNRIIAAYTPPPSIPGIAGTGTTYPADYIHHCHILEHEDNDMMRPWQLVG